MDTKKEFQQWYGTEGIRTPHAKDKHWHEGYCEIAFRAGAKRAFVWATDLIDKLQKELADERAKQS